MYTFQMLSEPWYMSVNFFITLDSIAPWKDNLPPWALSKSFLISWTCMFWSITPLDIKFSILPSLSAFVFAPWKISSAIILKASLNFTGPPIKPLASGKKEAVVKFLICVIGDKIVFAICAPAFNCIIPL